MKPNKQSYLILSYQIWTTDKIREEIWTRPEDTHWHQSTRECLLYTGRDPKVRPQRRPRYELFDASSLLNYMLCMGSYTPWLPQWHPGALFKYELCVFYNKAHLRKNNDI